MWKKQDDRIEDLRRKASEILNRSLDCDSGREKQEFEKIVTELRIHQVELELQNEELREAQIELEKQRDRYSRLFNNAPVGYLTVDASGIVIDVNQTLADMLDRNFSDIRHAPFSKFVHGEDRVIFFSTFKTLIRHSERKKIEIRLVRADGNCFHARLEAKPASIGGLYGEAGKDSVSGHLIAVSDITDIKMARDALKESREQVVGILESINDGFLALNGDLGITYFNKAAERILKKGSGIVGLPFSEAFPEFAGSEFEIKFREGIESGQPLSFETHFKKFPYENWYEARVFPYRDGISVFFRVVTEKKRMETQLRQAHKMEAIGTLSGGIAHDFNNILGIILGNIDLALDDLGVYHPVVDNIHEVRKACLRAREVVKQLLSFSRASEEEKRPIDIAPLIKESLKLMRASIPATIDIRQNIKSGGATVLGDPTQIHQVLINLCTNAYHAMDEKGGAIEIGLDTLHSPGEVFSVAGALAEKPCALLYVKDNGSGISPSTLERIFDPYFTTKDIGKGSGMGLSVVLGIVRNHGGEIFVDSKPGEGSTFSAVFPLVGTPEFREDPEIFPIEYGTESILIVDDEEAIATMAQKILERFGYRAEIFTDPVQALAYFKEDSGRFDLIVSDMAMPSMRGDRLAREILKVRPGMPIILCSGYNDSVDEFRAAATGIGNYLGKPFGMQHLLRTVRNTLDKKRTFPKDSI